MTNYQPSTTLLPLPKLLFVLGKGGVGRTTVATSLAASLAAQGLKVLVVQWALKDSISPLYSLPECSHKESAVPDGFYVMNFSPHEAIREYFVEHLKMRLLYSLIIENKYIQKLIHAAPGIHELFFLGRLFWLAELAQKERGSSYDHIIVDTPATGHGVSLFELTPAVANLGMTGPLASECERVTRLLGDAKKTGVFFVTLPEELPVEEAFDSIPKLTKILNMPPRFIFINQSLQTSFFPEFKNVEKETWFVSLKNSLGEETAQQEIALILETLSKRNKFENKLRKWADGKIPVFSLPDINLLQKEISSRLVVKTLTHFFSESFF